MHRVRSLLCFFFYDDINVSVDNNNNDALQRRFIFYECNSYKLPISLTNKHTTETWIMPNTGN